MNWVIIVGVLIGLMFLVAFSSWFYHVVVGINALIIEDVFVGYRIFGWGIGALVFMAMIFWLNALVAECPTPESEREGIFVYLDCRVYDWAITTPLGKLLPPLASDQPAEPIEQEAPTYPG